MRDISQIIGFSKEISKSKKRYLVDNLGIFIGGGSEGDVYEFGSRAIKFNHDYLKKYRKQVEVTKILKKYSSKLLVSRVYEQKYLGNSYWYTIMEKLVPLNFEEEKLVINFCSCYGIDCKNCQSGNRFVGNHKRIIELDKSLNYLERREGLVYKDWHSGNIMKSRRGVWKVVDINSFDLRG